MDSAFCETRPDCERRFDQLEERLNRMDSEQRVQGRDLAALKAQVALAGAVGSLAGGGIVAVISRLLNLR